MTISTPSSDPQVQAFLTRLTGTGLPVGDGVAPSDTSGQYAVFYPDPGMLTAAAADGAQQDLVCTVQVTCCGSTRRDADTAQNTVRAALVSAPLTVAGRCCWPVDQIMAVPATRDDQAVGPDDLPVFYSVAQYRWRSVPG